jgi:hypothetical protein
VMSERASNGFSSPTGALSLSLGVRPPRLGILVPMIKGLSWPLVMECALASQCQIWGGQANLLLGCGDPPMAWGDPFQGWLVCRQRPRRSLRLTALYV